MLSYKSKLSVFTVALAIICFIVVSSIRLTLHTYKTNEGVEGTPFIYSVTDELGWVEYTRMEQTLHNFWQNTNVIPAILIVNSENHEQTLPEIASEYFDSKFEHQDVILLAIESNTLSQSFEGYIISNSESITPAIQTKVMDTFQTEWARGPAETDITSVFGETFTQTIVYLPQLPDTYALNLGMLIFSVLGLLSLIVFLVNEALRLK